MEEQSILTSLAEIAAVFVGFSGIAIIFVRGQGGEMSALARFRLAIMLSLGLIVILGGLAPIVAFHWGLEGPILWRVVSLLCAAVFLCWSIYGTMNFFAIRRHPSGARLNMTFAVFLVLGGALIIISFLFNGLGIFIEGIFGVYLTGLLYLLGLSATMFLLLIFRTAEAPYGGKEDNQESASHHPSMKD